MQNPMLSADRSIQITIVLGALLLAGCTSPIADPSSIMQRAGGPPERPPAEKSQVQIHRPRAAQGYKLYTGVWDGNKFIADLGNGHSVAYICEPGTHYFINRSVERVGVVEGELRPGQTYALWLDTAGAFIASFQLEPVKRGCKQWEEAPHWAKDNLWVTRAPAADAHEQQRQKDIEIILQDFVQGSKKDRLRHLDPDDHP